MITYQDIKSGAAAFPVGGEGLSLVLIQIDGGTQSRANLNEQVVNEYAEAIQAGATFPPIVVFYDGKKHWLADGFHRFHAYQKAGREKVAADVRQGTRRDAILHSVGANETHGLRRTRDDKRRAVLTLLNDSEWMNWTDRQIANACLVDHKTVAKVRSEVTGEIPSERTYITKHGTTATMKTAGINASRTQFQAKASEDNGSITGGAGAVTGEASRLASGRTDAGEAASVVLPTIYEPKDTRTDVEREADAMVFAWDKGRPESREMFLGYLRGVGFTIEMNDGGLDVDRSATRASSAVEVGATNSPDGAHTGAVTGWVDPPSTKTGSSDLQDAFLAETNGGTRVTAGETALNSNPQPKTPRDADKAETVPPPSVSAAPFTNPRCQHPETCHLAHSRNECFDCNLAWSKRPKDEQVRLWAEAVQAARAA